MNKISSFRGVTATFANDILKTPQHILICGATGAGKSCVEFSLINSMFYLREVPFLMLIDPKAIDLYKYRKCKNVLDYTSDISGALRVLNRAVDIMERRYKDMQKRDTEICEDRLIYIVIDELADLVLTDKRINTPLQRLLAKGRASKIFVLMCTQCVNCRVVDTLTRNNVHTTICLRVENSTASRLVIGRAGAELLPRHGRAIIKDCNGLNYVDIPYFERDELQKIIDYWKK